MKVENIYFSCDFNEIHWLPQYIIKKLNLNQKECLSTSIIIFDSFLWLVYTSLGSIEFRAGKRCTDEIVIFAIKPYLKLNKLIRRWKYNRSLKNICYFYIKENKIKYIENDLPKDLIDYINQK